ncbi:metallophosphoesterase family protein [Actinoplanes palleronii]|uniref:Metallophosphoesterase n=1 Tax=Actinoplanes palleronii TaxID=113570 RepID=A0ABQ4BJ14_9ACTN|nr:metallophosphoesterase [Actinoplanes palleronii]GIE70648.1 metallophosphoesterase [Actinoplanes palleronii]
MSGNLFAISDLHVAYSDNRQLVEDGLYPDSPDDWLIVAGDVGEIFADVEKVLRLLRQRFAQVIWVPGNHELWTVRDDPVRLRGEERYRALVEMCRENGIHTPEDPFPVWHGPAGNVTVAPLFTLYDYSWLAPGTSSKNESLEYAYSTGVVCTDEMMLFPDPYPNRESWCAARVVESERRLSSLPPGTRTVLVSHWPLVRQPTEVLWHPEFAQWCGTTLTAGWHTRFRAEVAVYGHLHIPRTTSYDGVRFQEVSLGYPREWRRRSNRPTLMRRVLP